MTEENHFIHRLKIYLCYFIKPVENTTLYGLDSYIILDKLFAKYRRVIRIEKTLSIVS